MRVRDFRGVDDVTLSLGESTVLLGENNVGKSTILEALDIAIGDRVAVTTDLRVTPTTAASRFVVDLELRPWAGQTFDPTAKDVLDVFFRIEPVSLVERYFVRVVGEPDDTQRSIRLRRGFVNDWTDAPTVPFIAEMNQVQRRSLWFSLLDAQRDLVADLRVRGSPWSRLLRRLQLDPALQAAFEAQLQTLSGQILAALPSATDLATEVGHLQGVLAGQVSNARLAILPASLRDLWRTTDLIVQAAGHAELPIGLQGMGARSLASLLAFRAWLIAEMAGSTEPPLLVVTGFEEPEAHLHPQAQRSVAHEIRGISGQKIVSTHSPHVAATHELDDFRVIRRDTAVRVCSAEGISAVAPATTLTNIRRFCLSRNGDMVFARLVILGEGDSEAALIPEIARVWWGAPPESRGVAIVPMDGVGSSHTFASFLNRIGVPWIVLVDGDAAGTQALQSILNDPDLNPKAATQVVLLESRGVQVDLETFVAREAPNAVARTFGANPRHVAAIAQETEPQLVQRLTQGKAVASRRVGEELARGWTTRAAFPLVLNRLFTVADTFL